MKIETILLLGVTVGGCSFQFELTSQRTALENQILGSYREIDDDMTLMASVRAVDASTGKQKQGSQASDLQKQAIRAKQNQDFNRDDVDEFKALEAIGEANDGTLVKLPDGIGKFSEMSDPQKKFALFLVEEENRDRQTIWQRVVESNENLSKDDLPTVKSTYAKSMREASKQGQWLQQPEGEWTRK